MLSVFNAADADAGALGAAAATAKRDTRACSSAASNGSSTAGTHALRRTSLRGARRACADRDAGAVRRRSGATVLRSTRVVPTGVRARRGPGLLHHHRAGAGRRVARVHHRASRSRPRRSSRSEPEIAGRVRGRWASASAARRRTAGMMFVRLKDRSTSAKGPSSRWPRCSIGSAGSSLGRSRARMVVPFLPPAIRASARFGGFQFEVLDQSGGDIEQARARHPGADRASRQRVGRDLRGLFSSFTRQRSAAARRRSIARRRAASGCRSREVTDALQVFLGLAVRERLRLQQPRLSRLRAGRPAVPRRRRARLRQFYVRADTGEMVPLATWSRVQRGHRAAGHQPLQPVPLGRDHRSRRRRATARARRCRRWSSSAQQTLPAGFSYAWAGSVARGDQGRAGRPVYIFAPRRCCSSTWCWRRSTRAGCCRSSSCSACRWRCSARWPRRGCAGCQRRVLPGRPGDADRPGGEELDPDRRVRRAAARRRACRSSMPRSRRRASGCGRS